MRSKNSELKTKICDTVNDWKRNVGRTPSLKELGDEIGVNKSTIYRYLVEMNEDGLLEYDGSSIDTIEDAKAYVYSFSSRRRVHGWQNIKIRLKVICLIAYRGDE